MIQPVSRSNGPPWWAKDINLNTPMTLTARIGLLSVIQSTAQGKWPSLPMKSLMGIGFSD